MARTDWRFAACSSAMPAGAFTRANNNNNHHVRPVSCADPLFGSGSRISEAAAVSNNACQPEASQFHTFLLSGKFTDNEVQFTHAGWWRQIVSHSRITTIL